MSLQADSDATGPVTKKLKRNQEAFTSFCHSFREIDSGLSVFDQSKALADRWRSLSEAEKDSFMPKVADENQGHQREITDQSTLPVEPAKSLQGKKDSSAFEMVIPVGRVRRTCKLDPDVKNITKEATALVAKATERFLAQIAEESFKISSLSGRRTLKTDDIRDCVNRLPQYEWLRDDFPQSSNTGTSKDSAHTSAATATLSPSTTQPTPVTNPSTTPGISPIVV